MDMMGSAKPEGDLAIKVIRNKGLSIVNDRDVPIGVRELLNDTLPSFRQSAELRLWKASNFHNIWRGLKKIRKAHKYNLAHYFGLLELSVVRQNGERFDLGVASTRVVTTAGVNFIRDAFLGTTELENMKFHGIGIGTTAEATGDTALVTELTTEYATNSTRPTGTQVSGGTGAYQTVGLIAPDSGGTLAITEHGIFSQAATGGGTLLDRSVFSAVNLVSGADSLEATYTITASAGG